MSIPEYFQGYGVDNTKNWDHPKLVKYVPKKFLADDVLIKVEYCGVCGSDVHTVKGDWGDIKRYDLVVGHEIAGTVVKVGDAVTEFKVGQRVGYGPLCTSCHECEYCTSDNEQYCEKIVTTYNGVDYQSDNYVTQGGYANYAIARESFVFAIPDDLPLEYAAPMLCGGLTVFSPLYRELNGTKGKTVAIVGIGGLGHMALEYAKPLGAAKVVAISRSSLKRSEALKLGADEFIATGEDKDWEVRYARKFDYVLNCATSFTGLDINKFIRVCKVGGKFHSVGAPAMDEMLKLHSFQFLGSNVYIGGSAIGSKKEAYLMLELAAREKLFPLIEKVPLNEENALMVIKRAEKSDVRYRFVFTDFDKAFT